MSLSSDGFAAPEWCGRARGTQVSRVVDCFRRAQLGTQIAAKLPVGGATPFPHDHNPERSPIHSMEAANLLRGSALDRTDWKGHILPLLVLPPIGEDIPPLPEAVAAFKEALKEARTAEDHQRTVLTEGAG